jgi:hypothetical protein
MSGASLKVSKASRFALKVSKASRFALKVSKASRFALSRFDAPRASRDGLPTVSKASRSAFMGFLAVLMSALPAWAGSALGPPNVPASGASLPNGYLTVKHLGESEQQATAREGELLSHRRATDPFGNNIRGPFKGLPPTVEHPTPTQPSAASQVAAVVNGPTLERAVQELTIGALNVATHEILIGSRQIREGDLLVLESGGQQFVAWVQSVGVRGVLFCDIDVQKHFLKAFGSGPKELPAHSDSGISDLRNFLRKDAQP